MEVPAWVDRAEYPFTPESFDVPAGSFPRFHSERREVSGVVMVEQVRSVDLRSRDAKRIGGAPAAVLAEALSILDACIY